MAGKSQCTGDPFMRGSRLSKLMEEQGLKTKDICDVMDYEVEEDGTTKRVGNANPTTISRWKSGKYPLSDEKIAKLCAAYNLSPNYFDPTEEDLLKEFTQNITSINEDYDNEIELTNLERLNDNELENLTNKLLKYLKFIPLHAGINNQIVFYGHDPNVSYNPSTHKQYSLLKSEITQNGLLKTLNPILFFLRDENKLRSYHDLQTTSLNDDSYMRDVLLGRKKLWDEYPEIETWEHKSKYLLEQFIDKLKPIMNSEKFDQISVFTIAPQPLILQLGYLIPPEIPAAVFQLHEDTLSWKWRNEGPKVDYTLAQPDNKQDETILNVSLSTNISDKKIRQTIDGDQSIWKIYLEKTNNTFLQTRTHLAEFTALFRETLEKITSSSHQKPLHIFLSVPSAISFEMGRELSKINNKIHIYGLNGDTENYEICFSLPL